MGRNVILIVIDCLRADHLSCYGYQRETTPTIDALARHGILWENAYSTCSWTKPSVASLLTGLYPSEHGVLKGPKRTRGRPACLTDVLHPELPHIAQTLKSCGWRSAAFLNNVQLETYTGFDRGFHTYVPVCAKADRQIEQVDQWLSRHRTEPFLIYIHLMETHWPYKPRRRHVAAFGGNRDESRFSGFSALDFARLRRALARKEVSLSDVEREDLVRMYDAAVRRLDGKIKDLQRILDRHDVACTTALVVTSDHGEEFFEHGSIGHGTSLHVEATHVPLIVWTPDNLDAVRHASPVSLADVPRTLLSLTGTDVEFPGCDLIAGGASFSPAYCELSIGQNYLRAIHSGRWRLHRRAMGLPGDEGAPIARIRQAQKQGFPEHEHCELYDLASDPGERTPLPPDDKLAITVDALTWAMDLPESRWAGAAYEQAKVEIDDQIVCHLRALGYIE